MPTQPGWVVPQVPTIIALDVHAGGPDGVFAGRATVDNSFEDVAVLVIRRASKGGASDFLDPIIPTGPTLDWTGAYSSTPVTATEFTTNIIPVFSPSSGVWAVGSVAADNTPWLTVFTRAGRVVHMDVPNTSANPNHRLLHLDSTWVPTTWGTSDRLAALDAVESGDAQGARALTPLDASLERVHIIGHGTINNDVVGWRWAAIERPAGLVEADELAAEAAAEAVATGCGPCAALGGPAILRRGPFSEPTCGRTTLVPGVAPSPAFQALPYIERVAVAGGATEATTPGTLFTLINSLAFQAGTIQFGDVKHKGALLPQGYLLVSRPHEDDPGAALEPARVGHVDIVTGHLFDTGFVPFGDTDVNGVFATDIWITARDTIAVAGTIANPGISTPAVWGINPVGTTTELASVRVTPTVDVLSTSAVTVAAVPLTLSQGGGLAVATLPRVADGGTLFPSLFFFPVPEPGFASNPEGVVLTADAFEPYDAMAAGLQLRRGYRDPVTGQGFFVGNLAFDADSTAALTVIPPRNSSLPISTHRSGVFMLMGRGGPNGQGVAPTSPQIGSGFVPLARDYDRARVFSTQDAAAPPTLAVHGPIVLCFTNQVATPVLNMVAIDQTTGAVQAWNGSAWV